MGGFNPACQGRPRSLTIGPLIMITLLTVRPKASYNLVSRHSCESLSRLKHVRQGSESNTCCITSFWWTRPMHILLPSPGSTHPFMTCLVLWLSPMLPSLNMTWAADHPVGDTSCCELYAAFVLETCTRAPVKISGTCARGKPKFVWTLRSESLEADAVNTVMSQDAHAFTHVYKQGISVFPASLQPGTASLVHIGRSVHKAHGVMLRTKFISNIRAATVLQDHFAHNGRYLNFIFHP